MNITGKKKNKTEDNVAQENIKSGTMRIVEGIEDDGTREALSIIAEAEKTAAERVSFAEKKAAAIIEEAERKASEQAALTRSSILSSLQIEEKREKIRFQDAVIREIISRVCRKISSCIDAPSYRSVLVDWIIEAAIGLGALKATVNASARERGLIDKSMLEDIRSRLTLLHEEPVDISVSEEEPLKEQGIILTSADGRTAFNNQVVTRLRRIEEQIRNRIYDALFTKETVSGRS